MFLPILLIFLVISIVVMIVQLGSFGLGSRLVGIFSAVASAIFASDGLGQQLRAAQLVTPDDIGLEDVEISLLSDDQSYIRVSAAITNNAAHSVRRIRISFAIFDCPVGAGSEPDATGSVNLPQANVIRAQALRGAAPKIARCKFIGSEPIWPEVDIPPGQTKELTETILYQDIPEFKGEVFIAYRVMLVTSRTRDELSDLFKSKAKEKAREQAAGSITGA